MKKSLKSQKLRKTLVGQFSAPLPVFARSTVKSVGRFKKFLIASAQFVLTLITAVVLASLVFVVAPSVYYQVFPVTVKAESLDLSLSPHKVPVVHQLPAKNSSLPEGNWLVIPRIGVRTPLQNTIDPKEALDKGVWMDPEFGKPGEWNKPIIVAGHRYGWQWWWKTDYWQYHSFYRLPELEVGDKIEIISDQRKWVYEIYQSTESDTVHDYAADLIVYTCKYLTSPARHFRYARLVDTDLVSAQNSFSD